MSYRNKIAYSQRDFILHKGGREKGGRASKKEKRKKGRRDSKEKREKRKRKEGHWKR